MDTRLINQLATIRARLTAAARRAGRWPERVTLIAVSKVHGKQCVSAFMNMSALSWLCIVYLGCIKETGAVLLHMFGLQRVNVSIAALFTNFMPIVASIGAVLFLGEHLSKIHTIAGVLILLGVAIAVSQNQLGPYLRTMPIGGRRP